MPLLFLIDFCWKCPTPVEVVDCLSSSNLPTIFVLRNGRGTKPKPSMGGPKPGQKGGARERVVASAEAHFLFCPFRWLEGKGKRYMIGLIINDDGKLDGKQKEEKTRWHFGDILTRKSVEHGMLRKKFRIHVQPWDTPTTRTPAPAKPFPLGPNVGLQATMGQTGYGKTRMMSHELLGRWEKMPCTKITHYCGYTHFVRKYIMSQVYVVIIV